MFKNQKWSKRIALVMLIVMSVVMLASCQSGRTYEDVAGDASKIYVSAKEQNPKVEYTGDPQINIFETTDPAYAPGSDGPDGEGTDTPDENEGTDTPDENEGTDTPDENEGTDTPDENEGTDTPDENEGTDTPDGNEGTDTPDEDKIDTGNMLKIISYNVRGSNDGGEKNIDNRAPRLEKVVKDRNPDLMGFQEVKSVWLDNYLVPFFAADYDYVNQYRSDDAGAESTPIFWKKDKFELVDSGYFWLSETPDEQSKGWDAKYYRICSWVKLKIKATGEVFLHYNSHFDFSESCHVGSVNLIAQRAKEEGGFTKYPVIYTGDCNMKQWTPGYEAFMTNGMSDVNWELDKLTTATDDGYHEKENVSESPIDFCFYSDALAVPLKYEVIDEFLMNGYVSDHQGLYIEVALK